MDVRSPRRERRSPKRHKRKGSPRSARLADRTQSPRGSRPEEQGVSPRGSRSEEQGASPRGSRPEEQGVSPRGSRYSKRPASPRGSRYSKRPASPRASRSEERGKQHAREQSPPSRTSTNHSRAPQPARSPHHAVDDEWVRPSQAESEVSMSDHHKLVLAVEYTAEYISDVLGPCHAPYVRYAMVCRAQQYDHRGVTPLMVLSACRRYLVENESTLPLSQGQRGVIIRDQVARKLSKSPSSVYPFALAVTARMLKVPPPKEVANTERQINSGNIPTVEDSWMSSKCTLSRAEFRKKLCDSDENALRETCVSFGLQRESVDTPEVQLVSQRLLQCGCHEALPMINASINHILSRATPTERFHLRSVKAKTQEPMSPRTRRRALCDAALGPPSD